MIKLGLGAVQIFCQIVTCKGPASKCHHSASRITNWEHESVSEAIIIRALLPVCLFYQPCREKFRNRKSFCGERFKKRAPFVWCVAKAPCGNSFIGKPATFRILFCLAPRKFTRIPLART